MEQAGDESRTTALRADPELVAPLVQRLRRIEGQVEGLTRMLESGRACADIVTQVSAVSRALDRVGFLLVVGELHKWATLPETAESPAAERLVAVERLFMRLP